MNIVKETTQTSPNHIKMKTLHESSIDKFYLKFPKLKNNILNWSDNLKAQYLQAWCETLAQSFDSPKEANLKISGLICHAMYEYNKLVS